MLKRKDIFSTDFAKTDTIQQLIFQEKQIIHRIINRMCSFKRVTIQLILLILLKFLNEKKIVKKVHI